MNKIVIAIKVFLIFIFCLLGFSVIWCLNTWTRLSMDELVYELSAPIRGVGSDMMANFFLKCFLPATIIVLVVLLVLSPLKFRWMSDNKNRIFNLTLALAFVFTFVSIVVFWKTLDVTDYIKNLREDSEFIEENYVDAGKVDIAFPEKKRNLVYIYLESMELTYTDVANGGGFQKSCIPELTELAKEAECFSDGSKLTGAYVPYGTTWTMGAMFAQSTGLPLKTSIGENMMESQESFFPGITSIGDILEDEGYNQVLLLGSEAVFGGRELFYSTHGNYAMHDYNYAIDNNLIPQDYKVFWGYEDEKLFENAKKELTELSSQDKPFNLTMLTVDTHFPDGYVCNLCGEEFGDNQYANVMACSSRQVVDFVRWIQAQDFYENTTVVICGDHTTMNEEFCSEAADDYDRRTITAILNSAVEKKRKNENIVYSTLDMFPTTLAALGAQIKGEQLGLGVNVFSDKPTLTEIYGFDEINAQFKKKSSFMESMSGVVLDEETMRANGWSPDADVDVISFDQSSNTITLKVDNICNVDDLKGVSYTLYDQDMKLVSKDEMRLEHDRSYSSEISLDKLNDTKGQLIVTAIGDEDIQIGELNGDLTLQAHDTISYYVDLLKERENIAIVMAAKGDMTSSALQSDFNAIRSLGIKETFRTGDSKSFYAVVDNPSIFYTSDHEPVSYDGVLIGNEKPLHLMSSDSECSIAIDGVEYSSGDNGLNFVIYDYTKDEVVDSACFDLAKKDYKRPRVRAVAEIHEDTVTFTVDKITIEDVDFNNGLSVYGQVWDDEHYKQPVKLEFQMTSLGKFSAEADLKEFDLGNMYLELGVLNEKLNVRYSVMDWHGNMNFMVNSFDQYLSLLDKDREDRIIIMSTKHEATLNLDEASTQVIESMGVEEFLHPENQFCSYMVITFDNVVEDSGIEELSYSGEYSGTVIELSNGGWQSGYYSSILINGKEYSRNEEGINIVVYNTKSQRVEDILTYNDTLEDESEYKMER